MADIDQTIRAIAASLGVAGCLFAVPSARADYQPLNFVDLAGASDTIAVGTITALNRETFELLIEDAIAGAPVKGDKIIVHRFGDWPCASRWSRYAVGQKLLVFLDASDDGKTWGGRGAACEGESPVVGVAVHANFFVDGKPIEYETTLHGKTRLNSVPYAQLRTAIVDFRAAYRLTRAKDPLRRVGTAKYADYLPFDRIEEVAEDKPRFVPRRPLLPFYERSGLHRFLAEEIEAQRKKLEGIKEISK